MELTDLKKLIEETIESKLKLNKGFIMCGSKKITSYTKINKDREQYLSLEVVECYRRNAKYEDAKNQSYYVAIRNNINEGSYYSSNLVIDTKIYNKYSLKKINKLLDEIIEKFESDLK